MTSNVYHVDLKDFKQNLIISEVEKKWFWEYNDAHFSKPLTPLFASFMGPSVSSGTLEAFEKLKLPLKQFQFKISKGYHYQTVKVHDNPETRVAEHKEVMTTVFPRASEILFEYVENTLLPYYSILDEAKKQKLSLEEAEERVLELYQMYLKIWSIHFEVVMPKMSMGLALEEIYGKLLNTKDTTGVYDLLLGTMNKSIETDRELWRLSLIVKDSGNLSEIFNNSDVNHLSESLNNVDEGRQFLTTVKTFLETYGYRASNHEFNEETWVENPNHALTLVKNYIEKDFDFEAELQEGINKREQKVNEVLARMPDGELKETFISLYGMALRMWGINEDHHFYIDAMLPAKARLFLLNVGGLLVNHSVIEKKEDISYLYLDELVELLRQPKSVFDLIKERKEEHKNNEAITPVPFYGNRPEGRSSDPITERMFGTRMADLNEEEKTFTGYSSSVGVHTGTVKVVSDQSEFDKVKKGDILVCKTTTPPWTVLFNLAGVIVTDVGGILSHAATVAREYGVPCVTGTKIATSTLKDGDVVKVDGAKGEVTILE
ncbi:PEP-utilizing enzyme [Bacillus sp. SM2101]|uniref:PEP-utilizing enzyme n=1 Tax=Bacillus sp. SM2101 TaxID=2805366 RepID=UPI001BDEC69D|nr:PEP-utilizing enzyme [Bacillus sp. SM2101]